MIDRQFTRIDTVRQFVDEMLKEIQDEETKRCGYVHLYGVGQLCAFISLKRGHNREYAELSEIAGMLHDFHKYKYGVEENHAEESAKDIYLKLCETNVFSKVEIDMIYEAIKVHSKKDILHDEFSEILKDADAFQHYLRNPMEEYFYTRKRIKKLLLELLN